MAPSVVAPAADDGSRRCAARAERLERLDGFFDPGGSNERGADRGCVQALQRATGRWGHDARVLRRVRVHARRARGGRRRERRGSRRVGDLALDDAAVARYELGEGRGLVAAKAGEVEGEVREGGRALGFLAGGLDGHGRRGTAALLARRTRRWPQKFLGFLSRGGRPPAEPAADAAGILVVAREPDTTRARGSGRRTLGGCDAAASASASASAGGRGSSPASAASSAPAAPGRRGPGVGRAVHVAPAHGPASAASVRRVPALRAPEGREGLIA